MFTTGRIDENRRDAIKEMIYEDDDSQLTVNEALSEYHEMEAEVDLPENTSLSAASNKLGFFVLKAPTNLKESTPYFKVYE
mgnify:CR=1 FL=1